MERTVACFGKLDTLVNNHGVQIIRRSILEIPPDQLTFLFQNNFFLLCLPHPGRPAPTWGGGAASSTPPRSPPIRGHKDLIDYSATKGAIVALTRSLALSLAEAGIRVNGVAPGPSGPP